MKHFDRSLYPWSSHFLQIDGNVLHYLDEGTGEPILMLHGNPTWSFYYRRLVKAFSPYFRCVVPDHMGMGLSGRPQNYPYQLESHIQNALKLVDFLNLKNITLVVHDWGGAIGMGVATRRPELIKRVVILNTAAFLSQNIPKRIALCRMKAVGEALVRGLNGFAWPATFMSTVKPLHPLVKEGLIAPYDSWANRVAISRFVQDIPLESDHPSYHTLKDIEKKLPLLNVPKLIIWGGKDFCFDKTFYDRWREFYPEAESHWLEDAGHYVLEDAPQLCIETIAGFIGGTA